MKRNSRQIVVTFPIILNDIKEGLKEIQRKFRDLLYVHLSHEDAVHLKRNLSRLLKRFYNDLDILSQNSWEQINSKNEEKSKTRKKIRRK